jgi:hypothetical protein
VRDQHCAEGGHNHHDGPVLFEAECKPPYCAAPTAGLTRWGDRLLVRGHHHIMQAFSAGN